MKTGKDFFDPRVLPSKWEERIRVCLGLLIAVIGIYSSFTTVDTLTELKRVLTVSFTLITLGVILIYTTGRHRDPRKEE